MAVVHYPVKDRCGRKFASKDLVPSSHQKVGRDDERAFFISLADDLKEKALSFFVHF